MQDVNVAGVWLINCLLFPLSIYFFRFINRRLIKHEWWNSRIVLLTRKRIVLYLAAYFFLFLPSVFFVGWCISEFIK